MQREIKFRAKRVDNDMWAYGYFVKTPITTAFNCDGQFLDSGGVGRYCIIQDGVAHEIQIDTLGQYTGLQDKNGVEIYEGDIVKWREIVGTVEFRKGKLGFCHEPKNKKMHWVRDMYGFTNHIEVIGNIYENH